MNPKIVLRIAAASLAMNSGYAALHLLAPHALPELLMKKSSLPSSGFGLVATLSALACLLWGISLLYKPARSMSVSVLWPVLFTICGFALTGWLYALLVPTLCCGIAAVCTGLALIGVYRRSGFLYVQP